MSRRIVSARGPAAALLLALGAAACTDRSALAPEPLIPDAGMARIVCVASVRAGSLTCDRVEPVTPSGISAERVVGGQDRYVKLASSGTVYDAGTEILSSVVTVQNLVRQAMGTPDGVTVEGVRVYFDADPVVTSGTGTVTLANADGSATFTAANQEFYLYNEILQPYQISQGRNWLFAVPSTVNTFEFTLYVAASMTDEQSSLLDRVWNGLTSTDWSLADNWNGLVPDSLSAVQIPPAAALADTAFQPALTESVQVFHLRVGQGSSLNLGGFSVTAGGNVEGVGAISGGSVILTGGSAILNGFVPAVQITGSTRLQAPTQATGPVSVQGTLTTGGQPLSIQIP